MIEYLVATNEDKKEIIDLINYVFTQDYEPHDFKALQPKVYGDEIEGLGTKHYIVKEEGKIKAVVAIRICEFEIYGKHLKSVNFSIDDAKKMGLAFLVLSGKKQRYGHFGFENGGIYYSFDISIKELTKDMKEEIKTALELHNQKPCRVIRNEEEFFLIMNSWNCKTYVVYKSSEMTLKIDEDCIKISVKTIRLL